MTPDLGMDTMRQIQLVHWSVEHKLDYSSQHVDPVPSRRTGGLVLMLNPAPIAEEASMKWGISIRQLNKIPTNMHLYIYLYFKSMSRVTSTLLSVTTHRMTEY